MPVYNENPGSNAVSSNVKQQQVGNQLVELDHTIGFSGKINNSVYLHPNQVNYVSVAGCSVVSCDLNDPHSQHFLTAHDN